MFPSVLTEDQARQTVNLPPSGGTPDAYTDRVLLWIEWVTELADLHLESTTTDVDGLPVDRWPTTADLPPRVTRFAEEVFRENWASAVGAHSPAFGEGRFEPEPPTGPYWVVSPRAFAACPDLRKAGFA